MIRSNVETIIQNNAIQKRNLTSPSKKLADLTAQNFNEEESFEIVKILSASDCPYLDY